MGIEGYENSHLTYRIWFKELLDYGFKYENNYFLIDVSLEK
jgi:hypothetical protein